MRSLVLLVVFAAGCQPPVLAAHGTFIARAPAPVITVQAPAPVVAVRAQGQAEAPPPPPPPADGLPPPAGVHAQASITVRVSFFGIPLDGSQDVVFVLDRSGSMSGVAAGFAGQDVGMSETGAVLTGLGASLVNAKTKSMPTKMQAAKDELIRTLSAMPDGTRFMIIFFDNKISAFSPRMLVLEPRTRTAAIEFVRGIKPGGSTAAVPALRLAYQEHAARVVLLSDGLANTGGGGDTLLAEARAAMRAGVRFDTVGLGIDQDSQLLSSLAAESGGLAIKR